MAKRSPRWQRRRDARPAEILEAALACFAQRGFAATRMDDIAERAGVTKGTLYLYFSTKEDLFKELVRGQLVPHIERLEALAQQGGSATEQLERLLGFWAEHVAPSRIAVIPKLIIAEAGNFPELARFYLHEVVHRGLALVRDILRGGVKRGEFRSLDIDHVAYLLLAPLVFSVLWQHSFGPYDDRPLDVGAMCRAQLDLLRRGLRTDVRKGGKS